MNTKTMKHVWPQGYLNMLYCMVFALGSVIGINWLVMIVTKRPLLETTWIAFAFMLLIASIGCLISWIRGIKRRGSLQLDCGFHPMRKTFQLMAAIFFAGGMIVTIVNLDDSILRWAVLIGIDGAVFFYCVAQSRLAIYENGVWSYGGFADWNRFKEYSWADDGSMIVKLTGSIVSLRKGVIVMPPEHAAEFRQMFEQHMR